MNVSSWSIKNPIPAVMLFVMLTFAGMLAFKPGDSLYGVFGSAGVAGNTGVVLQNRAAYFSLYPQHPNRLEPRKTPLHTLIERAGDAAAPPPPGYEAPLTPDQQAALLAVVKALGVLVGTLAQPACRTDFQPVPRPELRVRPPL